MNISEHGDTQSTGETGYRYIYWRFAFAELPFISAFNAKEYHHTPTDMTGRYLFAEIYK
nr:hypothetical protein [Escherichia coli O25b:H4-ST131]